MTNLFVTRLAILILLLPCGLLAQGWQEITPQGFLTEILYFRSFEFQNGGFEVYVWNGRRGFRLDQSLMWDSIPAYSSYLCDSVSLDSTKYELLDIGKSYSNRNRTYSLYRKTGCLTGSLVELYVDTTGAVSRQRLLSSYSFSHPYGNGSIAVSAAENDLVFLKLIDDTLRVSSDGGETFVARVNPIPRAGGDTRIYLSPFEPNKVFINDFDGLAVADFLYMSTDRGMSWSQPVGPGNFRMIDFHPTNPFIAYGPTPGSLEGSPGDVYKTTDGGNSWTIVLNGADVGVNSFTSVEVHKENPDTVYAGTSGKIFYTTDAGITWGIYNNTFTGYYIIGIFQIPSSDTLIVAAGDGVFKVYDSVVGVDDSRTSSPERFALEQNYPNPFNPSTKIRFEVPGSGFMSLKVFDLLGQEVATLVNEELKPGSYEVTWDASGMASGVYFYRLTTGTFTETKKLVHLR